MFTLNRPLAGLLLAVLAAYAAGAYEPLYAPEADLGTLPLWSAGIAFVVGWVFVGGRIGRALWFSIYMGLQGVVLAVLAVAGVMAVREVFILGYRRRYPEVMDAITGYFDIIIGWLGKANDRDFLILLGVGGVVIGVALHILHALLEGRRNAR